MPTYQYRCMDCFTILERKQGFGDAPLTECPTCSGSLRRVLSPAGIIFKGSGWYCTDSQGKMEPEKTAESQKPSTEPAGASAK